MLITINSKYCCNCLGGETIKQINQQSGAHCELDRRNQNQQQSGGDKTFIIRGDPDQIETAKRIISDKVQMPLNFVSVGVGNSLPTVSFPFIIYN